MSSAPGPPVAVTNVFRDYAPRYPLGRWFGRSMAEKQDDAGNEVDKYLAKVPEEARTALEKLRLLADLGSSGDLRSSSMVSTRSTRSERRSRRSGREPVASSS
jgi:hypothetical protein